MKATMKTAKLFRGLALGALVVGAAALYVTINQSEWAAPSAGSEIDQTYQASAPEFRIAPEWERAIERSELIRDYQAMGIPWQYDEFGNVVKLPGKAATDTPFAYPETPYYQDPDWNESQAGLFLAQMSGTPSMAGSHEVVTGAGTIMEQITRTTEDLTPCPDDPTKKVQLARRVGSAAFDGLISNALADGQVQLRAIVDPCADPTQGPFTSDYSLVNATVAGLTGDLKIQVTALTRGSVLDPGGARSMGHFTIQGVSGELKHAEGQGLIISRATPTSSFRAYYAEIRIRPH